MRWILEGLGKGKSMGIFCASLLYCRDRYCFSKQVLILEMALGVSSDTWLPPKQKGSTLSHGVKMGLPGSLGLPNFLSSQCSASSFVYEIQIKLNSQCVMNFCLVEERKSPPLFALVKYPPSLMHVIQSLLRVSDIGLIWFCLDSVLSCPDASPDPCSANTCSTDLLC